MMRFDRFEPSISAWGTWRISMGSLNRLNARFLLGHSTVSYPRMSLYIDASTFATMDCLVNGKGS